MVVKILIIKNNQIKYERIFTHARTHNTHTHTHYNIIFVTRKLKLNIRYFCRRSGDNKVTVACLLSAVLRVHLSLPFKNSGHSSALLSLVNLCLCCYREVCCMLPCWIHRNRHQPVVICFYTTSLSSKLSFNEASNYNHTQLGWESTPCLR